MPQLSKAIEYLFYLFIFLLPWQTRWIWHWQTLNDGTSQYLSFSLHLTEIILLLILVLTIIYKLKNPPQKSVLFNPVLRSFYLLLILLIISLSLSLILAQDFQLAFYYLVKFLSGFALVILITNFKLSFKKNSWALVLSGFIQAILSIIQFITQQIWASKWLGMASQLPGEGGVSVVESASMRWLRSYGSLPHPNILGGFLALCFIFLIILIFKSKTKKAQSLLWLMIPVYTAGLVFSFSKSALIAFFLALIIFLLVVFKIKEQRIKHGYGFLLIAIFITSLLLTLIYPDPFMTRFTGQTRLEVQSIDQRLGSFQEAGEIVRANWLQGVGLGNYTLALHQLNPTQEVWAYQPVHNVYFLILAETGILGLLVFIALIILIIRTIWQYRSLLLTDWWFLATSLMLLLFFLIMLVDHYFWTLYFGIILFWLSLGLWLKCLALFETQFSNHNS